MELATAVRPGAAHDAVDGVVPRQVAEPESPQGLAAALAHAASQRLQTVMRGGGTKLGWGRTPAAVDLLVDTRRMRHGLVHRHGDLTVTVQAGTTLRELNEALRAHGQWLPVESAFDDATVGGIVATNDAGPSRQRNGTPRDLVIGITLALTDGRLIKAGGSVVKNVAGYDLGKLVSGSHGALAGIADVTFKLVPLPQASATLVAEYATAAAMAEDVAKLAGSQVEAAAFDVWIEGEAGSSAAACRLVMRVATSPAATDAQIAAARALVSGDAMVVSGDGERHGWASHIAAAWSGDAVVRLSWLPARLASLGGLLAEMRRTDGVAATLVGRALGTGLVGLTAGPDSLARGVERLRASADVGNVVVLKAPPQLKSRIDVWGPPPPAAAPLRALKATFDPAGILNAGRGPI